MNVILPSFLLNLNAFNCLKDKYKSNIFSAALNSPFKQVIDSDLPLPNVKNSSFPFLRILCSNIIGWLVDLPANLHSILICSPSFATGILHIDSIPGGNVIGICNLAFLLMGWPATFPIILKVPSESHDEPSIDWVINVVGTLSLFSSKV